MLDWFASVGFRILRDAGEAEDITQLVFLEIFQAAAQFDPARGNLKGWLLQYAYHRSINRRDYLAKRKFYDSGATSLDENGAVEVTGVVNVGVGHLAFPELRSLMRQGLAKLSLHQHANTGLARPAPKRITVFGNGDTSARTAR
jgi:RNA polymerase sigma-70 factor (ECF subfamily)